MWAKISNSAIVMACAACLATAATLPAMGTAAEQVREDAVRTAALLDPITQLDAFSALGLYGDFLTNPSTTTLTALLNGVDATSAVTSLAAGNITALDAFSAIPNYQSFFANGDLGPTGLGGIDGFSAVGDLLNGNITALDAFSAIPNYQKFLATGDLGPDGLGGIDAFSATQNWINFFSHGDLSRATGLSGIDAFSALPVYNAVLLHGDISALAPDTTSGAGGIAAFSAVPGFLGIPAPVVAPDIPYVAPTMAAAKQPQANLTTASTTPPSGGSDPGTTPPVDNTPVNTFKLDLPKPKVFTPPAPPAAVDTVAPKADLEAAPPSTDSGSNQQNVQRTSQKFTPKGIGGNDPLLFGSGTGADNGMPGWQKALKSIGIGGGSDASAGGSTDSGSTK